MTIQFAFNEATPSEQRGREVVSDRSKAMQNIQASLKAQRKGRTSALLQRRLRDDIAVETVHRSAQRDVMIQSPSAVHFGIAAKAMPAPKIGVMPSARERPRWLRPVLLGLALWLLTTGSSCQATFGNGGGAAAASGAAAGASIAALLVGGIVYCTLDFENCFPDEDALQARYDAHIQAQARFAAGLRRHQAGDPEGLELICLSAHGGYRNAQYFYGSQLMRREPERHAEGLMWLRRAAAQGHRMADLRLRRAAARLGPVSATDGSPNQQAFAVANSFLQLGSRLLTFSFV